MKFSIILNGFGRTFQNPVEIYKSDLMLFKSAAKLLNKIEYYEGSTKVTLFFDWSEVVGEISETLKIESMSREEFEKWKPDLSQLTREQKIYCEVDYCSHEITANRNPENSCLAYVLRAIYELFIILNLASPGSFNFLKCEIEGHDMSAVNTSAFFFENALLQYLSDGWPKIELIDLSKVINWIRIQKIGDIKFAKSKIEKCIYSLIHASISPANELSTIMWITYSLEALYEVPVGRAFTSLFSRISEVLSLPQEKSKKIKSQLRCFYDERNKFAHGGAPIVHPIEDLYLDLDSEAGKFTFKIQMLNAFGFSIALSTLQKYITDSLSDLVFIEKIERIPMIDSINST